MIVDDDESKMKFIILFTAALCIIIQSGAFYMIIKLIFGIYHTFPR